MRAILYNENDKQEKIGKYPNADMSLVENLPNGWEWQIIERDDAPILDSDNQCYKVISTKTNIPHSVHSHLNVTQVTYEVFQNRDVEILERVTERVEDVLAQRLDKYELSKTLIRCFAVLFKKINGETLTTREVNVETEIADLYTIVKDKEKIIRDKQTYLGL